MMSKNLKKTALKAKDSTNKKQKNLKANYDNNTTLCFEL